MSDQERQERIQKERQLIGEPITGYCSDAYNTLISVVQGGALAALCYVIQDYGKDSAQVVLFWPKVFVAFWIICTIWHRYIVDNQYLAWTIGIADTIIPMSFAVLQVAMVLAILKSSADLCLTYFALFICGFAAYCNSGFRHNNERARAIYNAHFQPLDDSETGEKFGGKVLNSYIVYARKSRLRMLWCALISEGIYLWLNEGLERAHPQFAALLLLFFAIGSSSGVFRKNLRFHFNHDPKIRTILGW